MFTAQLKLPSTADCAKLVDEIITDFKLTKVQDNKIGGPSVTGVSGGEWKRTSIGVELITNPNLIFLDEPTTGLDSYTAASVIEVIKKKARQGWTIVTTIHQPTTEIFAMFDQLMLLANGWVVYHNKANKPARFFSETGYPVPLLMNPTDHYLNITSIQALEDDLLETDPDLEEIKQEELEWKYD